MPESLYPGSIKAFACEQSRLVVDCGGPRLEISVLTERIVRVRLAPTGVFAPRRSWAVTPPDAEFAGAEVEVAETAAALLLRTPALTVAVEWQTGRVAFYTAEGHSFCADATGMSWAPSDLGGHAVRCSKQIAAAEHFYGFGERTGLLDQLGSRLVNWTTDQYRYMLGTDPLYIAIPTFLALQPGLAYGLLFNNSWHSTFDMGFSRPDEWTMEAAGGELDYYVCLGPEPAAVLAGFAQLLGTTPLPPRWALGYHQSRWGYLDAATMRELASTFRRLELPCDAIHFDIDYMDGYRDFTWNAERFPDPAGVMGELREQGIRVVTIVDPGVKVDPDYSVYAAGMEQNMFIRRADGEVFHGYVWPDDSVFPDFMRPEVREWWASMQQRLVDAGASGIWNDMNEPTVFKRPFSEGGGDPLTIDLDALQGPADERTTHAEVHNLYGSAMARAAYEGLRQSTATRPFVLTRSAFAGIQRWSACWMGDNTSRWDHLELAVTQVLNMGLSGVPFVGTDIGGFFDNASGELFARWMQFGTVMPFCRGHSHAETQLHEPWRFGPRTEAICREYLNLRYHLLPYLYTLFWESSRSGAPVVRPLLYHFPADPAVYQLHDQVLLGAHLMAAPVLRPGCTSRAVYLPAGEWFDWWTSERFAGGQPILAAAPLERMPLYARAGAIIPGGPQVQSTTNYALDPLTLHMFAGTGEWTLYEDDGLSFNYERGVYSTTTYRLTASADTLVVELGACQGAYCPPSRALELRIYGVAPAAQAAFAAATYDAARRMLTARLHDHGQAQRFELPL